MNSADEATNYKGQIPAIESNETQYGEKATYFQHSPLNSRTLVNHEPTMITASPNIHQTAAVVSNWQALLVLFEIERKKSVKTQRETKLSPASWLERKVASKLCGRGQICFVKGGNKRSLICRRWRSSMCVEHNVSSVSMMRSSCSGTVASHLMSLHKRTNTTEKVNGKRGGELSSRQRDSLTTRSQREWHATLWSTRDE